MRKGRCNLRFLAGVLAVCMAAPLLPGAGAAAGASSAVAYTQVDPSVLPGPLPQEGAVVEEAPATDVPADDEAVRVVILLEDASVVGRGFSTLGLADNPSALAYSDGLIGKQDDVRKRIETQALDGQALQVAYQFTIGVNGIATTVPYGKIDEIERVAGVQEVYLENRYELDETVQPDTATAGEMVGSYSAWADGYTGAGSRVAIIDTGIDRDHPSFSEGGFQYGLARSAAQFGKEMSDYDLLTIEEIEEVLPRLHASERLTGVTAQDLYTSEKIPFGFNYIMGTSDYDCDAASGDHGCHVAGIAAANTYIPYEDADGDVYYAAQKNGVTGVAPNAQVLAMKVFSDGWGAYESDYMAAIEDAIWLNCDAVNLSLGSSSAGRSYTTTYAELFASILDTDTVITMSAGNNGGWSDNNLTGTGLNLTTDVRMQTGGSPGSYTNSFAVASVTNQGLTGIVGSYNGYKAVAGDTGGNYGASNFETLDTSADQSGTESEYVFLGDPVAKTGIYGTEEDFAGRDYTGKIVLVSRGGDVSFFEKANRAVAAGAVATIVYNHVDGTLNMDLTGYAYTAPAVILSKADGEGVLSVSTQDDTGAWGGKVIITNKQQTVSNTADGYQPSTFSSWGVTENLALKPEILAPGGNIYSTLDGGTYGNNSGTSMAAPSVAGSAAVVAQYIQENGLAEKTGLHVRTLAIALLMGTAEPLIDDTVELPYSPRLQGAGLSRVYEAVTTPAYLLVGQKEGNDGKVKLEFGDDPDRTGVYSGHFSIHNLTDQPLRYSLDSVITTMAVETIDGAEYMSKSAYALSPQVTFETQAAVTYLFDLNGDGKVDELDAKVLLQVANDTAGPLSGDADNLCDLDADGVITTTDVQLFLAALRGDTTYLDVDACAYEVPADGSIGVDVTISLSDADRAYFGAHYPNGGYVDGYLYVNAEDGTGKQMSIPLLAYYGNWTEPSMYDKYILLEDVYDETACGYVYDGYENYLTVKFKGSSNAYYYMPNLYAEDDTYLADRNAFANTSTLYQANISLIRNADHVRFVISNADTGEIYSTVDRGASTGAYYSSSSGAWGAVSSNHGLNWYVTDAEGKKLPEGTRVNVTACAVPEYYWDRENERVKGELADGAYWTTTFTIDNTPPEAASIAVTTDVITGDRSLEVKVKDNRYTAAVMVLSLEGQALVRSAVNQTSPGVESTVHLDLSEVYTNHFLVAVYDYASNVTVYEVNVGGSVETPEADAILTAALSDRDGLWFVDMDADDLSAMTTRNAAAVDFDLLSVARGADGVLYAASNEDDGEGHLVSSLYTVDETSYAMTKIGSSEGGYCDMSWAPSVNGGTMLAAYGPYILVVDTNTGNHMGAWTVSSYTGNAYVVGMAYVGTQAHDTYGQVDIFMVLCSDGTIYQTGFAYHSAEQKYVIFSFSALAEVPGMANGIAGSSLYCAKDGKLFISALTEQGSKLSYIDLTADSVWLFELGTLTAVPVSLYEATEKTAPHGVEDWKLLLPMEQTAEAEAEITGISPLDR